MPDRAEPSLANHPPSLPPPSFPLNSFIRSESALTAAANLTVEATSKNRANIFPQDGFPLCNLLTAAEGLKSSNAL